MQSERPHAVEIARMHEASVPLGSMASTMPRQAPGSSLRPQSVMLVLTGAYLLDNNLAVYSGSVIDVFGRLGVQEQATRSTLSRMAKRGILERHRRGRRVYFGVTARSSQILRDGLARSFAPVEREWDGRWTLFGFSLPDEWRSQRHALRSRLLWAGFGRLQNGLWIAPSEVDVEGLLAGLGLHEHIIVFTSRPSPPTDITVLIRDAYDLERLRTLYERFIQRWEPWPDVEPKDRLAAHLLLQTDWLRLVRLDPRLPLRHLPRDWPAVRAEQLFKRLYREGGPVARALAAEVLDVIPVSSDTGSPDAASVGALR